MFQYTTHTTLSLRSGFYIVPPVLPLRTLMGPFIITHHIWPRSHSLGSPLFALCSYFHFTSHTLFFHIPGNPFLRSHSLGGLWSHSLARHGTPSCNDPFSFSLPMELAARFFLLPPLHSLSLRAVSPPRHHLTTIPSYALWVRRLLGAVAHFVWGTILIGNYPIGFSLLH